MGPTLQLGEEPSDGTDIPAGSIALGLEAAT